MSTPDTLLSLSRDFARGEQLRTALAYAISEAVLSPSKAQRLHAFLTDALTKVGTRDTAVPTVSTRVNPAAVNKVVITFNEGLDPVQVPAASAFAIVPARTITAVEIVGAAVHLTYSGAKLVAGDTPTVAYTQPGATQVRLQDPAGNLVATAAAAAVTVV